MKRPSSSKARGQAASGGDAIAAYSRAQPPALRKLCDLLRRHIDKAMPGAASKVWHGSPVWLIDDNPVVGYNVTAAKKVHLLFWNGQALDEAAFEPVGKYGAAQAVFGETTEIQPGVLQRWLRKAKANVFDSRGFFKKLRESRK